jgi:hypothetical protein
MAPLKTDLAGARVSTETSQANDEEGGLSIRYVEQYNASTDQSIQRFDVLYGWAVVRPELGCLIKG